jgi:hypothetical protein
MKKSFLALLCLLGLNSFLIANETIDNNNSEEISFFTKEGDLDMSEYMSQAYGLLPIPIIIT